MIETGASQLMNPPPVFVGGTGRSGTTVVAELIGQHSSYHMIPIEARFHLDRNGLIDTLAGNTSLEVFFDRMRGEFFERTGPNSQPRGLHQIIERSQLEESLSRFEAAFAVNRFDAARQLFGDLFDPLAESENKGAWVEMTPGNVGITSTLLRIFPEAKVVHTVRDGRDVASSVVAKHWGPSNVVDGIHWWSERLRQAEAEARMATGEIHLVKFDELIYGRRQAAFTRLCSYLEIEADEPMLQFFKDSMTPSMAHLSRWRRGLSDDQADYVDALYRRVLHDLRSDGVSFVPVEPDAMAEAAEKRANR